MKIAVIANGEWDPEWGKSEFKSAGIDVFICADGGANHLIASGHIPDVVIGDLDSILPENLNKCQQCHTEIIRFPKEKDQTDLELAVSHAQAILQSRLDNENHVFLYAGGGKRLDHLLGNISLMIGTAEKGLSMVMRDQDSDCWVMLKGQATLTGKKGQELSIIPLSETAEVTTWGLYYELNHLVLNQNAARGVSNFFSQNDVIIEVHHGKILIIKRNITD